MKTLLYLLGIVTWIFAAFALMGVGDSAIRQGVAVILWTATLVALGAAAICGAVEAADERASKRDEQRRVLLLEIRELMAKPAPPAPAPEAFDAAKTIAAARPGA